MSTQGKNPFEDLCAEMVVDFNNSGRTALLPVGSTAWIRCCSTALLDGNHLVLQARACPENNGGSQGRRCIVDARSTQLAGKLLALAEEELETVGAHHEGMEFKFDIVGSSEHLNL
jgi:hypothetical protein